MTYVSGIQSVYDAVCKSYHRDVNVGGISYVSYGQEYPGGRDDDVSTVRLQCIFFHALLYRHVFQLVVEFVQGSHSHAGIAAVASLDQFDEFVYVSSGTDDVDSRI